MTDHGNIDRSHKIGEEDEGIFEHSQHLDCVSLIVVGDLASEFPDALLDLFS